MYAVQHRATNQGKVIPFPTRKINTYDDEPARHDAEPWKDRGDIQRILDHFYDQHLASWSKAKKQPSRKWNPRYLRNYLLILIGCNCGLRASDLIKLQLGHFIKPDGNYRDTINIQEQKTSGRRTIYINEAMRAGIDLYKEHHPQWRREDYIFPNGYNASYQPTDDHITRQNLDLIIKNATKQLEIENRNSTHTLRKSFAYHALQDIGNDDRGIKVLQQILGHTSIESTHHYLGITQDEIKDVCMTLNIGKPQHI